MSAIHVGIVACIFIISVQVGIWISEHTAKAAPPEPVQVIQTVTGNFPRDLYGPPDARPVTWGHAEAAELPIKFNPPAGYRVRILRLRGDMTAWPKVLAPEKAPADNTYSGILVGFSTTAPEGSVKCDWCADNTLLYVQDGINGKEVRQTQFDWQMYRLLEKDHTLVLKIASWLNTTGYPIHIEATWQANFIYEKESK